MIHAPEAHTNTGGRKGLRALDCACSNLALPCSFGSQSLRKLELDERREVGVIVRAAPIVKDIERIFEDDWQRAGRK